MAVPFSSLSSAFSLAAFAALLISCMDLGWKFSPPSFSRATLSFSTLLSQSSLLRSSFRNDTATSFPGLLPTLVTTTSAWSSPSCGSISPNVACMTDCEAGSTSKPSLLSSLKTPLTSYPLPTTMMSSTLPPLPPSMLQLSRYSVPLLKPGVIAALTAKPGFTFTFLVRVVVRSFPSFSNLTAKESSNAPGDGAQIHALWAAEAPGWRGEGRECSVPLGEHEFGTADFMSCVAASLELLHPCSGGGK
mmetsp:Transcript_2449/g.4570  ORF Transcript_2449/g.4570 Transcript_2449/m.4570 type:complete len:247 (-) Transcript_2449:472-1212(-)